MRCRNSHFMPYRHPFCGKAASRRFSLSLSGFKLGSHHRPDCVEMGKQSGLFRPKPIAFLLRGTHFYREPCCRCHPLTFTHDTVFLSRYLQSDREVFCININFSHPYYGWTSPRCCTPRLPIPLGTAPPSCGRPVRVVYHRRCVR